MGGEDKGLLTLAGRPAVEYALERLRPQVDRLLINANRNLEAYRAYGYPVVTDREGDFPGPLGGMAAALDAARTDFILTVPCDTPWLPEDLAQRLITALRAESAELATVDNGQGMQPVFALLPRDLRASLAGFLAEDERKIDRWYSRHRVAVADFSDRTGAFTNINTPEERAVAEPVLGRGRDHPGR